MKSINKADIIYISSLVIAIFIFSGVLFFTTFSESNIVMIEVDGEIYGEYSLNEDMQIDIEKIGKNTIRIEDGSVKMTRSDCPDKTCISHGSLKSNLGSIVCLPNKVIVWLEGDFDDDNVDMVS